VSADALSIKRKKRALLGHRVEYYICNDCWKKIDEIALPYIERGSEELKEGDDYGIPFECHRCGEELKVESDEQSP
jgi:hypothetical protein